MRKWVCLMLALALIGAVGASAESLTTNQRYNVNLFLSNFTEQGFAGSRYGSFAVYDYDVNMLTEFAIDHCWFNRQNRLEWGDYFNGNNVRLPESQIAPIVEKYFGLSISPSHYLDYIDYSNGYYYWEETGGHTSDGFACLTSVEYWDYGMYQVWFDIYGMGENWSNDVCYFTPSEAQRYFPRESWENYSGYAIIDTHGYGLDNRDKWSLYEYEVNQY